MQSDNFRINNSNFTSEDLQIIMLVIWGLTAKQMTKIIGCEEWQIKVSKSKTFCKLGVDGAPMLAAKAIDLEFKREGTFRGEKLFTPTQEKMIIEIKPILRDDLKR